jgi:DNA polymerase III subunit delta
MKYGAFMASLRQNGLQHVYLLAGEEPYYIEKAEQRLLGLLFPGGNGLQDGLQKLSGDLPLNDLAELIETMPFLTDKNVILLRGSSLFREKKGAAAEDEKDKKSRTGRVQERFLDLLTAMPETSYIIFETDGKADKRKRLYKTVEKAGALLEAEPVRAWTIDEWLRSKLMEMNRQLDSEALRYFMSAVGMMQTISLQFLDQEFNKLAMYTQTRQFTKQDLLQVFSSIPEVSGFAMLDAISAHDAPKALSLLERQLEDGVFPPLLLAGLVRHVRQLWQAKTLQNRGVRGRLLGGPLEMNPYIAEKLGRAAQTFSEAQLHDVFLALADADYQLKTGQAGPEVLEQAVIRLCRRE